MPVSEKDSGIVGSHTDALQGLAKAENTFLFVRPTEYDTTILIRAGYATKSMDVHHKSSNWGPMAGFVPCDPAFSKKCEGKPNAHEHEHKHGDAHPTQLALKPELVEGNEKIEIVTNFRLVPAPASADKKAFPWIVQRVAEGQGGMAAAKAKFEAFQTAGNSAPDHKFCYAKPRDFGNKSTLFCLVERKGEWFVFWVEMQGESGLLRPLRVFAYPQKGNLVPVTGDYDLWMVAPHFAHFGDHAITKISEDSHGKSAASGYTIALLPKMNAACGRTDNPVFNHGAESQNYGFTQALDWNLAMFTPAGTSRMVRMNQMPGILADLAQSGYLVVWNKRYGESDPRLMGKADARNNIGKLRETVDTLFNELDMIRRQADAGAIAKQAITTHKMPALMQTEIAKMADRFAATRNLGLEQSRIYRFHRLLLDFLAGQAAGFRALAAADFPAKALAYSSQVRTLHMQLQSAMVGAMSGDGQSDATLGAWMATHKTEIDQIKTYWKV